MFRTRSRSVTKSASANARRRPVRLFLEELEDRTVPAGTLTGVPFTSLFPQFTEGQATTAQIATVFDTGAAAPALTISINWGDGTPVDTTTGVATPAAGAVGTGAFSISGTHTYAEESSSVTPPFNDNISVTVSDTANGIAPIVIASQTSVVDANQSQGNPVTGAAATPTQLFSGVGGTNTSTTAGSANAALTAFEAAIGGPKNTATAPQNGGFRTITWDGVKTDGTDAAAGANSTTVVNPKTVGIPLDRFEGSGVYFGAVYAVSGDNFVGANPSVAGLFNPFSSPNIFAMFNDNGIDFKFVVPAATNSTIVSASSSGFGAIFLNVEQANTTSIQYFNGNNLLATEFAPVSGTGGVSFIGALFPSPVVTRVVLSLGTDVLFSFDGTNTTAPNVDSRTNTGTNLVATDDWAFPEPVATPNGLPIVTGAQGTTNAALLPVTATATVPFTGVVGSFNDQDPNGNAKDFTATINWGDGHLTNGTITANAQGGFDVSGTNTYAKEGLFPINIDVADFGGGNGIAGSIPTTSINNTLKVLDAPLTATGTSISPTFMAPFTGTVATFTDADTSGLVGQFTASINWGDGTAASTGTVTAATAPATGFVVGGTHSYTKVGNFTVTVTINDVAGATATATSKAVVGKAEQTIGVYDPTNSIFLLRNENSSGPPDAAALQFGLPGDIPVIGDWNGDGVNTIGVFNPTTAVWDLRNENNSGAPDAGQFAFGLPGDIPVVGDWTGTGKTGIGVFRPSTGQWFLRNESSSGPADAGSFFYGSPGLTPVTGDWKGAGHTGIGVYNPATGQWLLRTEVNSGAPDAGNFAYGGGGALPVVGDWNASGHAGIGIFSQATFTFLLRNEVSGGGPDAGTFAYGGSTSLPVAGTWALPGNLLLAPDAVPSPAAALLTNDELQATVQGAMGRLEAAGVSANVLGELASARFSVGLLPAGVVGQANTASGQVLISANAAGAGWFVDPTPAQDEEFGADGVAPAGSPAAGSLDLLTAVLHEMGHLVGAPDVSSLTNPGALMGEAIEPGVRLTSGIDAVFGGTH